MPLLGDSLTLFELHCVETMAVTEENPNRTTLMTESANKGLEAVATDAFLHCALFFQKWWMEHGMKKPRASTMRQTVASPMEMNDALPVFPGVDKHSQVLRGSTAANHGVDGFARILHQV